MKIDVLTLFPNMFSGPMNESIIGKAIDKGIVTLNTVDFRDFANNKHNHVDDYPFGGGAGMLLKVEPIDLALQSVSATNPTTKKRIILLDPAGEPFTQEKAEELANEEHLIFICGHYEGYDERIRQFVTDEISIGDYVLTGGELATMVMIDATVRLIPDVVGNRQSIVTDSHSTGLLEHPQYTRPRDYKGMSVPDVLFSGNHAQIERWQLKESLRKTLQRRPELLEQYELSPLGKELLVEIQTEETHEKAE